jgi:hypothetical protein
VDGSVTCQYSRPQRCGSLAPCSLPAGRAAGRHRFAWAGSSLCRPDPWSRHGHRWPLATGQGVTGSRLASEACRSVRYNVTCSCPPVQGVVMRWRQGVRFSGAIAVCSASTDNISGIATSYAPGVAFRIRWRFADGWSACVSSPSLAALGAVWASSCKPKR